jgi:TonB family protein
MASALTLQALFFGGLFILVVMAHVAITTALRAIGIGAGVSLAASGSGVLLLVVGGVQVAEFIRERRAAAREMARIRHGLPSGPCCVVWGNSRSEEDIPWAPVRRLRADYPELARRLGVEGVALVGLEIGADGRPQNVHCIEAWPSNLFYHAAAEALAKTRFTPRGGVAPRPGGAYRIPFVFRIAGASRPKMRKLPPAASVTPLRRSA